MDLAKLKAWADKWLMKFNLKKGKILNLQIKYQGKGTLFSMDREVTAEKLCFLTFQWRELYAVNSGFSKKSCLPASTFFSAVAAVQ